MAGHEINIACDIRVPAPLCTLMNEQLEAVNTYRGRQHLSAGSRKKKAPQMSQLETVQEVAKARTLLAQL